MTNVVKSARRASTVLAVAALLGAACAHAQQTTVDAMSQVGVSGDQLASYRWWLAVALIALCIVSVLALRAMRLNRRLIGASQPSAFRPHAHHGFSDPTILQYSQKHWTTKLQHAIANNRFRLYCEPFIPILPGAAAIQHYEILLRMIDRDGREVSPMSFIPAAESLNLMPTVDRWVVATTLAMIARHSTPTPGKANTPVFAINLSGQSLSDDEFLGFIVAELERSGVAPTQICFEITETAAIANLPRALRLMNVLRNMGCRFALDDFGSGLSSFAYLKNLPVDYLKIDGTFLQDRLDNPVSYAIVDSINQIGRLMGLKTIAECVTDTVTLERVKAIGADYAQGHSLAQTKTLEAAILESSATHANARVA